MTTPAQMTLPAPKLLKDVLDGLTGKPVTLTPRTRKLTSIDVVGGAIALYVDDRNKTRVVVGWSLAAAAHAGCAFSLLPANQSERLVKERFLPTEIVEAVHELSNVLAGALHEDNNPHVRLSDLYHPAAMAPTEIGKLLYEHYERMDFDIEVPGYGTGFFSIVVIA